MKSPSRSRTERAAAGFTLLEVLIASAIATVVLGMVINAYVGANKALNATVGGNQLKMAGEKGLEGIYRNLKSAKKIFGRGATADSWLGRTDLEPYKSGGLTPKVETADLVLPDLMSVAYFGGPTPTPAPTPALAGSVGNALFFVTTEQAAVVADPSPTPNVMATVFGSRTYRFTAYRLHLYHLARRDLGKFEPIRGTDRYTYSLMHWTSEPYLDYYEVKKWMSRIMTFTPTITPTPNALIDAKLDALSDASTGPYAGVIDLSATDASTASSTGAAMYGFTPLSTARQDLTPDTTKRFKGADYRSALDFAVRDTFAYPMVAFNNGSATSPPPVKVTDMAKGESLAVPMYAPSNATQPYGFEVIVGGPASGRQVLLRLALAAKSGAGSRGTSGLSVQQIVQVYEY